MFTPYTYAHIYTFEWSSLLYVNFLYYLYIYTYEVLARKAVDSYKFNLKNKLINCVIFVIHICMNIYF